MSDEPKNNVVELHRPPEGAPTFVRAEAAFCPHTTFRYCTENRTVVCHICEAHLDPFSVLMMFAIRHSEAEERYERIVTASKYAHERVEQLKRVEKAIVNRIKKEGGNVHSIRGATAVGRHGRVFMAFPEQSFEYDVDWRVAHDLVTVLARAVDSAGPGKEKKR